MDDDLDPEYSHETLLQTLLIHLLRTDDLDKLCDDADLPVLVDTDTDTDTDPVRVASLHSYRDAGVLTLDRGVLLELSDGSAFGLTVTVSRRPTAEVTVRGARAGRRGSRS